MLGRLTKENHEEKICVVDLVLCAVDDVILRGSRLFQSGRMVYLAGWSGIVSGDSYHLSVAKAQMNTGLLHGQFDGARCRFHAGHSFLNAPQGK